MDGRVILNQLDEHGAQVQRKVVAHHTGRAHRLSLFPASTSEFLSVGDDGVVLAFDLREA